MSREEPPPLLGSWRNLYAAVLANLALVVLVLWLLTRAYS
jgi:hypothetical protein